jgi:predicted Fe-Mo cluster-binding NifX family protein
VKIAISARGPTPFSDIDERFGRAYWFLVYCDEDDSWLPVDNRENRALANGAGSSTAEMMKELEVDLVLTGETGPKAFRVLNQAGIKVCHGVCGLVSDVLEAWKKHELQTAKAANDNGSPNCLMTAARQAGPSGGIYSKV